MPNGVICAGAVDGSNQAGAIVTCHAMTARPAGGGPSAADAEVAKASIPRNNDAAAIRQRSPNDVIPPPPPRRLRSRRLKTPGLSADLPGRGNKLAARLSAGMVRPTRSGNRQSNRLHQTESSAAGAVTGGGTAVYVFIPSRAARECTPADSSTAGNSRSSRAGNAGNDSAGTNTHTASNGAGNDGCSAGNGSSASGS